MNRPYLKSLLFTSILGTASVMAGQSYTHLEHSKLTSSQIAEASFKRAPDYDLIESKDELAVGDKIMVHDRYQSLYSFNEAGKKTKVGTIARLDRIEVLDLAEDKPGFIKIKILSSVDGRMVRLGKAYTRINGLSQYQDNKDFDAEVYMVQNVATEKLRVYQRVCMDNSCPPRLLLETEFVAGMKKNDPKFNQRTRIGNYRIFEWHKFYQDKNGGHYPSWYDPSFPAQPEKDASWGKWFKKDVMPWKYCKTKNGKSKCSHKGMMRGAFGWYTALVEPNYALDQWTHGTIGWGESSEKSIATAKGEGMAGFFGNLFSSLRSSGCSRVSNPTIAFLRHILPPGTPLMKIYAIEKYQDQESVERNYDAKAEFVWDYALTKDGVRGIDNAATSADLNFVMQRGLSQDEIIEEGQYKYRNYPHVVQHQGRSCKKSKTDKFSFQYKKQDSSKIRTVKTPKSDCNLYKIKSEKFVGTFYVDTGLLSGYKHPRAEGIKISGFKSQKMPAFLDFKNYKK